MTAAGDGGLGVHRAARHRVHHRRRDRDDEAGRAARTDREFADVKVSPLLLVAKAVLSRPGATPSINAAWDEAAQEIVVKHYVNLGIAAATPRGLMVPEHQGRRRDVAAASWPTALGRARRRPPARAAPSRPTWPAARSPSPTSASSASTPARRSSTPASPRSCAFGAVRQQPWVRQGQGRAALGHHAGAVVRPPAGRRRAGLAVPGRPGRASSRTPAGRSSGPDATPGTSDACPASPPPAGAGAGDPTCPAGPGRAGRAGRWGRQRSLRPHLGLGICSAIIRRNSHTSAACHPIVSSTSIGHQWAAASATAARGTTTRA